jgi:hypothetical protein
MRQGKAAFAASQLRITDDGVNFYAGLKDRLRFFSACGFQDAMAACAEKIADR